MNAPHEPILLELPSSAQLLPLVRSTLLTLAETCPSVRFEHAELEEFAVALQEGCTNAVRHGNGNDARKLFRVTFVRRDDGLEVWVEDEGPAFALSDGPGPDPEALQEGGYGTSIMRAWSDEVHLTRQNGRNRLSLLRLYRTAVDSQEIDRVAAC